MNLPQNSLIYIHDPMCSWCWGFRPTLKQLVESLPASLGFSRLLGGLAADCSEPMPDTMQDYLKNTWRTIEQRIPGTRFNHDFWQQCQPRRSTYPACRAVISARNQGSEYETPMIDAIQYGYYLQAKNPSDNQVLIAFAEQIGLQTKRFENDLKDEKTQQVLLGEIKFAQKLGVSGFPSLVLQWNNNLFSIPVDYQNSVTMRSNIKDCMTSN